MIKTIQLQTMREAPVPPSAVLCLGNFDGVHIGHRALIRETLRKRQELAAQFPGVASGVWFFRDPPSRLLTGNAIPQITRTADKLSLFAGLGVDYAFLADFSDLMNCSPEDFVNRVLRTECACVYTVCGFNFRFGRSAAGDAAALARLMGGNAEILDCVTLDGVPVSSSTVRRQMEAGDIEQANRFLGHPYFLCAEVIHGKALGRTLGVPTVNQLFPADAMRPANGVYISRTLVNGRLYPSVSNVGVRPSVGDDNAVNCETHIIGLGENLYGRSLRVEFLKRLRGEETFASLAELTSQLHADIDTAKHYFQI